MNVGEQIQLALFKHYNRCFLMHYLQGVSDAIEVLLVLFRFLSRDFFYKFLKCEDESYAHFLFYNSMRNIWR